MKISQQAAMTPVQKMSIGSGETASINTLHIMKDVINRSSGNYYIRRWAEEIVKNTDRCPLEKAKAIHYFLLNSTEYLEDPTNFEMLKTPPVSLQLMEVGDTPQLDCDDYTVLSLSLMKAIGFHVAIRAVAYKGNALTHVYGMVAVPKIKDGCSGGDWYAMDLTNPNEDFGWEKSGATRVVTIRV